MDGKFAAESDSELLRRSAKNPAAFGDFYDRHVDAILGYFYRRTNDAQTTLDLTAETFAAAFTARKKFTDTGAPARAWLIGIARRQLGTFARKARVETKYRRRMGVTEVIANNEDFERIEAAIDFAPTADAIRQAVGQLSPKLARAVELRVVEQLPFAEVGKRLGCSEGTARVRVSRGLTKLSEILEHNQ